MQYSEITDSIHELNSILQKRDEFIRACAEVLVKQLTGSKIGFPENEICVQPVGAEVEDSRSYHFRELPTDYSDGRRGFQIRFAKSHRGYLSGVIVLVKWVFSIEGDKMTAQMPGETESFETSIDRPGALTFIDTLAHKTTTQIKKSLGDLSSDPSVKRTMGFHEINS